MLTFSEEALLLLLDEEEGIFQSVGKNTLELAMAGAVLMDLAFADRIDTDLERMMVIDRAPTGDPLLDDVLDRIAQGQENNDTRGWIESLAVEKKTRAPRSPTRRSKSATPTAWPSWPRAKHEQ